MTYIRPHWSTTIEKKRIPIQKQNKNHTLDQRMQKTAQYKNIAVKTQRYRIISDYGKHFPKKNKNAKKNRKPQKSPKKIYKNTLKKQQELPFANMKQNMHLTEFTTTGLKQVKYRV